MIVDLHAHYPMHLVPEAERGLLRTLLHRGGGLSDRARALLVGLASRFANYRSFGSGPRVTMPQLEAGGVQAILSVLYSFFDEVDLDAEYGSPPEAGYLERLLGQLELVEQDVSEHHAAAGAVAHSPLELDEISRSGRVAIVHCVEGGFHLGPTPEAVDRAVSELAGRGVAYITLSHLFWRGVATNSPALPFLPDGLYRKLFPQPDVGLSELGRAAVRAMVRDGVLVDLSHMTERALADAFTTLDEADAGRQVPVLVSHGAIRFGEQEYGLSRPTVERIAERNGAIGLILAQHQLNDGIREKRTKTLEESLDVIGRHVDRVREITGSHEHVAIGSDFDGFIKPTMGGLESMADMGSLELGLRRGYRDADAKLIASENALRVLRAGWRGVS